MRRSWHTCIGMRLNFDQLAIFGSAHLKVHGFGEKIYANCSLVCVVKAVIHKPEKGWHQYIGRTGHDQGQYLVIRLVLPTLCSPRKTNLNFLLMERVSKLTIRKDIFAHSSLKVHLLDNFKYKRAPVMPYSFACNIHVLNHQLLQ